MVVKVLPGKGLLQNRFDKLPFGQAGSFEKNLKLGKSLRISTLQTSSEPAYEDLPDLQFSRKQRFPASSNFILAFLSEVLLVSVFYKIGFIDTYSIKLRN